MRVSFLSAALLVAAFFCFSCASAEPLVSVIIPTHQRQLFLAHALTLIRAQDYPNIEVVVVDDSPEPLSPDFLQQSGIRYVHLTERKSIGEKRNIAVLNARGEVIVHWDDDDYFRPHRISAQVKPILDGETDMTVLEHHFYLVAADKQFFTVKRASSWGPHFATFAYRRTIFEEGLRYPDNSMAEDYAFAEFALERGYKIKVMQNFDGKHVYVRHANTWQIDFAQYDAQVAKVEKPDFISQEDVDFYAHASSTRTTAPSPPPNNYASHKIRWDREELQPLDRATRAGASPSYPHYGTFTYNTGGQIVTIPIAAVIIGLTILGTIYLFYLQRKNSNFEQVGGYQPLAQEEDRLGAGPSKGYGTV